MLWAIAVTCALLWALAFATSYTAGGFIHVLLVVAVALIAIGTFEAGKNARRRRGARLPLGPREAIHVQK